MKANQSSHHGRFVVWKINDRECSPVVNFVKKEIDVPTIYSNLPQKVRGGLE